MPRLLALVLIITGCGGSNQPDMAGVDAASAGDLASASHDLAAAAGDLASDCTPATTGFYAIAGYTTLAVVSPDPNDWEGTIINVVDDNGVPVTLASIAIIGDTFYTNNNRAVHTGSLSSIQGGKLVVTSAGNMQGLPGAASYVSTIAPNGNKGDLIVLFSTGAGGYVGELTVGGGTSMVVPSNPQLTAQCDFRDFEGTVSGDNSTLDAICTNELDHVVNGVATTEATGTQGALAGMQTYQGTTYVMTRGGNVYDSSLHLIKTTRVCVAGAQHGKPLSVLGL